MPNNLEKIQRTKFKLKETHHSKRSTLKEYRRDIVDLEKYIDSQDNSNVVFDRRVR